MMFLITLLACIALIATLLMARQRKVKNTTEIATLTFTVTSDSPTTQNSQPEDKDHWEGSFFDIEDPYPAHATLHLNYTDGGGSTTDRTVSVRECGATSYGALLIGHCELRDATRTFRTDRINQCVDTATGEVIKDVHAYLRGIYEGSSDYSMDRLYNEEHDLLLALLYVGKADGQLRAAERGVIAAACKVITKDVRITDDQVKDALSTMDAPSLHSFKVIVGRINKRGDEKIKAIAMKASRAIVATQSKVSPGEQEALDYMEKRFSGTN